MNKSLIVTVFVLVVSACTSATHAQDTTTTTVTLTTTTSEATGATTNTARALDVVDCDDVTDDVSIVCEAYDLIKDRYVDEISDEDLAAAAQSGLESLTATGAEGLLVCATPTSDFTSVCNFAADTEATDSEAAEAMVNGLANFALDPNSTYFDPEALDLLQEEQKGEIEGIGALVSPEDRTLPAEDQQCSIVSDTCRIYVISPITGAPADAAGLVRDDVISAVDGADIDGWTVDEVTATVRGHAGSDVTLTIDREGDIFNVTITRAAVVIPVVETDVFGSVGYVRLQTFNASADDLFESAIVDVLGQGVTELVIDLRNNPGGFLDTAIAVTSVFLEDGDVVRTEGPGESLEYEVTGSSIVPDDMPIIVVVNKGSASASEVVSAVLQERGRATVVGENTFGKNTVQQRFSLSNGGALKLTIARWLTPGGHDFGEGGVTPDVLLDVTALDAEQLVAAVTG